MFRKKKLINARNDSIVGALEERGFKEKPSRCYDNGPRFDVEGNTDYSEVFPIILWGHKIETVMLKAGKKNSLYRFGLSDLYQWPPKSLSELLESRGQPELRPEEVYRITEQDLADIAERYRLEYNEGIFMPEAGSTRDIFSVMIPIDEQGARDTVFRVLDAYEDLKDKLK
ncbi:MAG: hypothetical protein ABIJ05_00260 [Patescibacteria group bacterium]